MTANTIERQLQMQCEKYTIDMNRLTEGFQQKGRYQSASAEKDTKDTVDISEDARKALNALRNQNNIKISGTVAPDRFCMTLKVFEDYEKSVIAEKREKVISGNFDRHIDKMVSAYNIMRNDIEEKYVDADEEKKQQIELLDKAYKSHSQLMAGYTKTMYDLRDFTPQIAYHSNKNAIDQQTKPENAKIWDLAYNAFMSAIDKDSTVSQGRTELNRIWDYYA